MAPKLLADGRGEGQKVQYTGSTMSFRRMHSESCSGTWQWQKVLRFPWFKTTGTSDAPATTAHLRALKDASSRAIGLSGRLIFNA